MKIILPDKHPLYTLSSDIEMLCTPLARHFNISHFSYVKIYPDLSRVHLSNSTEWSKHFYRFAYAYNSIEKVTEFNHCKSGWMTFDDLSENNCVKDARNHGIGKGILISEHQCGYTELFYMAVPAGYDLLKSIHINLIRHLDLLKLFTKNFKKRASRLIQHSELCKIDLPFLNRKNSLYNISIHKDINAIDFLRESSPDLEKFTRRECECAHLLMGGYGLSEISGTMNISYRTLEKHLRSLSKNLYITHKITILNGVVPPL